MIKYKSITLSADASKEASDVILSVPGGNKVTLRGIAGDQTDSCNYFMEIEGNRLIRYYAGNTAGFGQYIPLNTEVPGPQDIRVGIENIGYSTIDTAITLMYEE